MPSSNSPGRLHDRQVARRDRQAPAPAPARPGRASSPCSSRRACWWPAFQATRASTGSSPCTISWPGSYRGRIFALGREPEVLGRPAPVGHLRAARGSRRPRVHLRAARRGARGPASLRRQGGQSRLRRFERLRRVGRRRSAGRGRTRGIGCRARRHPDRAQRDGSGVDPGPAALQIAGPRPPAGSIGVVSQSGNVVMAAANFARQTGIGISRAVSVGNSAALGVGDYLEFLAGDDATTAIFAYVEGIDDGRASRRTVRHAAAVKPVVLMKGGVSARPDNRRHRAIPGRWPPTIASSTGCAARPASPASPASRRPSRSPPPSRPSRRSTVAASRCSPPPAVGASWPPMPWPVPACNSLRCRTTCERRSTNSSRPGGAAPIRSIWPAGESRDTIPVVLDLLAATPRSTPSSWPVSGYRPTPPSGLREGPVLSRPWPRSDRRVPPPPGRPLRVAAAEASDRHRKPVLSVTELGLTDPANPAPAAIRASGRLCYPTIQRAVRALDRLLLDTSLRSGRADSGHA